MNRFAAPQLKPLLVKAAASAGLASLALLVGLTSSAEAATVTKAFSATGAEQAFTVPAGVTSIHVVAVGAKGGTGTSAANPGGLGAVATADIPVAAGQKFFVEVGGNGANGNAGQGGAGGFNGGRLGGASGDVALGAGGGGSGGSSDLRTVSRTGSTTLATMNSRIIVAGGGGASGGGTGGGSGANAGANGGAGANAGVNPGGAGGQAATPTAPGAAGSSDASPGAIGIGGAGGDGSSGVTAGGGGAGGSGAYGGGGAGPGSGGGSNGGGGGGGSSTFAPTAVNTSVVTDTTGTPSITISYDVPASGGGGTGGGGNGGGTKPALSHLKVSPKTFVAGGSGGTTLSYSNSLAGKTTFSVQKPKRGVRVSGSCLKPGHGRHGSHCTRYVSVGSFSHTDVAGANSFHFAGRVRHHKLRPGSYRLRAVPTSNGTKGSARTFRFTVVS